MKKAGRAYFLDGSRDALYLLTKGISNLLMHIFYLDSTEKFIEKLLVEFSTVGFELKKPELGFFVQLSAWLGTLPPKSLVILIDEYDAPLTNCLDNPKLFSEIRSVMSDLFLTLKSREGCQRFFFMTGITKFSNTSIFSAFNNLQDISLDPKFS